MDLTPYGFVRAVTIVLATFWTLRGAARTIGFARNWERRLYAWGLSRRWLRRQLARVVLRATVFDPVNVALACVLVALWVGPSRGWFRLEDWRGAWATAPPEVNTPAEEATSGAAPVNEAPPASPDRR